MNDRARDDPMEPLGVTHADLAPADFRSVDFDWTGLGVHFVQTPCDRNFELGYATLWGEFGAKNEMETRSVLDRRLAWRPERPSPAGYALRYEMIVVRCGQELAAVRDHTAIVDIRRPDRACVVHLSHLLIQPDWRSTGLAGWMRALPLYTARECLRRAGQASRAVTLVAEMEPIDPADPATLTRLAAYEKVGFLKIDPARVRYLQPDFRRPDEIDAGGGPRPVPLSLVVRRVKHEADASVDGGEVRALVEALYAMYAESFRPQDLRPNFQSLHEYPPAGDLIALVPPTAVERS